MSNENSACLDRAEGLVSKILETEGEGVDLDQYIEAAHETAVSKGWHDEPRSFGDICALFHSEVSEAFEDARKGRAMTEVYWEGDKPCGIPIELADLAIRLFDLCGAEGIDLQKAITHKMVYNLGRPYRHGGKVF